MNTVTADQIGSLEPAAFEKLFWGAKAVGLKVALRRATPSMIRALLSSAWSSKAAKSLRGPRKRQSR